VRALEICREHGLQVLVQSTVMEGNAAEVPALIDFAREKGAWSFNLYFLVRTGRAQTLNDLSPARTNALLTDLVDAQDRYRPLLVRAKCAPQFKQIAYARGRGGLESGGCMAGTHYCRITPEGDLTPCPYMDVVAGNVRETEVSRIWEDSPVLRELRDPARLGGRCGRCEFKELCGGCRCRAYAATGDVSAEDPACVYEPTGEPVVWRAAAWSDEAWARLQRIPIAFIRNRVRDGVEAYAQRHGLDLITPDVMKEALPGAGRTPVFAVPGRDS
jgi:radical SAM protein with 4Fe4S-binding SPASM domain